MAKIITFKAVTLEIEGQQTVLLPHSGLLQPGGRATKVQVMLHDAKSGRTLAGQIPVKEVDIEEDVLVEYGYVRPISTGMPTKIQIEVPGRRTLRDVPSMKTMFGDRVFGGYPNHLRKPTGNVIVVGNGADEQELPDEVLEWLQENGYTE